LCDVALERDALAGCARGPRSLPRKHACLRDELVGARDSSGRGGELPPRALTMAGQGSAGNVLAAICSFFIPGLGQLVQGRLLKAVLLFVLAAVLWAFMLGWIIHLWSILDAAVWKPRSAAHVARCA